MQQLQHACPNLPVEERRSSQQEAAVDGWLPRCHMFDVSNRNGQLAIRVDRHIEVPIKAMALYVFLSFEALVVSSIVYTHNAYSSTKPRRMRLRS